MFETESTSEALSSYTQQDLLASCIRTGLSMIGPIGAIAGIAGAATYYLLVMIMDRRTYGTAIPASWVIMWLMLAALDGRWLRAPARRSWNEVTVRGLVAAIAGGVAFALVMNVLWGRPPAGGRNYLLQWTAWAFAWAPGLLALMVEKRTARTASASEAT